MSLRCLKPKCLTQASGMLRYAAVALLMVVGVQHVEAQKLITYEAGMGTRDKVDPDVWILYKKVEAHHEGMVLYADSALLNTQRNDFTAFRNIKIILTDTTVVYGQRLYYDGNTKVLNIWGDTVRLIDGGTVLKSNNLVYDRNTETATYTEWGHAVNGRRTLDSRQGHYNSAFDEFYIYGDVVLADTSSSLYTDTLIYNTKTERADIVSATRIYSDSAVVYSEKGFYYSASRYAVSHRASRVENGAKTLECDTLHYSEETNHARAIGHVCIVDTVNNTVCRGGYGENNQEQHYSYVTDSALVRYVDKDDTLYMHADTIYLYSDENNKLCAVHAYHKAKLYRDDVQGMSDSVYYSVVDSLIVLYYSPVAWYGEQQCTADTISIFLDSGAVKLAKLDGHCFTVEKVDSLKFNQVSGARGVVHFDKGSPLYADVFENVKTVYHITEEPEKGIQMLIGVNVGTGKDMRIYFNDKSPDRVVTYGAPDMYTYPLSKLPADQRLLPGFAWYSDRRPARWQDVFKW
ncbi:MAG: hypothetical protein J6X62_03715 [Bacteroidales bacterium]|nr:hypothetical protein [Bacteroidales bacterium]